MFPIINIGPLAIQAGGLILLLSLWIGTWLTSKFAEQLQTNGGAIESAILISLVSGIIGARLGFMLQNPIVFVNKPLSVFSLTPSMLNINFGLLIGALAAFIFAQKKHLPLLPTLDTLSPLMLLLFAGIHLANLANGNEYGLATTLSWGITLWNAVRHPVQLYALILIAVLLVWLTLQTRGYQSTGFMHSGVLFLIVVAGLGLSGIISYAFIAEKISIAGIDIRQWISFLVMAGSFFLLYKRLYQYQERSSVLISLGSNTLTVKQFEAVHQRIAEEFKIRGTSSIYQAEDVTQKPEPGLYLNQVIEITTSLSFTELFTALKSIEKEFGRDPDNCKIIPLDLDILTFHKDVFTCAGKRIPEPGMLKYQYIAVPLAELSPDFRHPGTGISIQSIVQSLEDQSQLKKTNEVNHGTER